MADRKDDLLTYQFLHGSVDAFKTIFSLHYKPLCSFAKKYVLNLAIAEDIVQELFIKLWEQRNTLQLRTSVKSYLFRATRNECINYLKHKSVEEKYESHLACVATVVFFHDTLEEEEINALVYETVRSLPSRCRQIFELSRFGGKTMDEIAEELSISRNTVKNQLVSALRSIRETLEKKGFLVMITFFSGRFAVLCRKN